MVCDTPPDFLTKHADTVLVLVGILGGGLGALLTYFMRSRCTSIKCCGAGCVREPLTVQEIEVLSSTTPAP